MHTHTYGGREGGRGGERKRLHNTYLYAFSPSPADGYNPENPTVSGAAVGGGLGLLPQPGILPGGWGLEDYVQPPTSTTVDGLFSVSCA